jgi:succinate dehydrogenase/fumarate reductase flavoprotein subunit
VTVSGDRPESADVAVVGGGPAGCSAAVFCARYGLQTVVFDRGRSSLRECAHLENYLGFPAGIDVETFYELAHEQVREAGGQIRADLVDAVTPLEEVTGDTAGPFRVDTQQGDEPVRANQLVAATRYDGAYLRPVLGEDAFESDPDEALVELDADVVDSDGRTSVDGLYLATPHADDEQVAQAVGRGARVARTLLADRRRAAGLPEDVATVRDWRRREDRLDAEWQDGERWREWFEEGLPADADVDPSRREREIDRLRASYLTPAEREDRRHRAHRQLAAALDPAAILDAIDDETIRGYLEEDEEEKATVGEQ